MSIGHGFGNLHVIEQEKLMGRLENKVAVITGTTSGTAGGSQENLTLISGSGTTTLTGAVGAGNEIGTLTLQADNVSACSV